MRKLSYDLAINEAFHQLMEKDDSVFVIGQGVKSPWYVGNTTKDLYKRFGDNRVIDTPVSENTMTGAATGASIVGMRGIAIHPRMDFMIYAVDQVVNEAANWHYMFGGKTKAPVVVRAIINRGGEQGAQHSQALQAWYAHVPGLKVVMPATPADAKGLLIAAVKENSPVMYIDDRWLYDQVEDVPRAFFASPIGQAATLVKGTQLTIAAISYMVRIARQAAEVLRDKGISVEVIDMRTVKPLDVPHVVKSLKKTGHLIVAEASWKTGGVAGELVARVCEEGWQYLKKPPRRVCLPDVPAPTSPTLETGYYQSVSLDSLLEAAYKLVR